jgi:hypothetical protein
MVITSPRHNDAEARGRYLVRQLEALGPPRSRPSPLNRRCRSPLSMPGARAHTCPATGRATGNVDRSAHAVVALRFALEEARIRSVELTVVEVWQQPNLSEDVRPDAASSTRSGAGQRCSSRSSDGST